MELTLTGRRKEILQLLKDEQTLKLKKLHWLNNSTFSIFNNRFWRVLDRSRLLGLKEKPPQLRADGGFFSRNIIIF